MLKQWLVRIVLFLMLLLGSFYPLWGSITSISLASDEDDGTWVESKWYPEGLEPGINFVGIKEGNIGVAALAFTIDPKIVSNPLVYARLLLPVVEYNADQALNLSISACALDTRELQWKSLEELQFR